MDRSNINKTRKGKNRKMEELYGSSKKKSTIININAMLSLYSRDNENWYKSYKETFTDEEWELMETQKLMESAQELSRRMEEKYNRDLKEAYEEYYLKEI